MKNFEQLKEIVSQYLPDDIDSTQIEMDSDFIQGLNINSANLVDIVLDVEDAFDIRLENEDMDGMKTVADALNIIEKKLSEKE